MKNCRMKILGMAKGMVLLLILSGLLVSVAYAAANSSGAFKDTIGHWASLSIDRLAGLGILGGYEDGTFKPNQQVSRAEMATIVNRTLDLVGYEDRGTAEAIAKGARLFDDWAKNPAPRNPPRTSQYGPCKQATPEPGTIPGDARNAMDGTIRARVAPTVPDPMLPGLQVSPGLQLR